MYNNKLDQNELARRTGLTQATISRYVTGKSVPSGENLILLADALDISIDYLLGRTDIKNYIKTNDNDLFVPSDIKKNNIETIAAHRTNGNNSDIKDVEGLKDLIRELINEEKNK